MENDYAYVIGKYSQSQLNKVHDILTDLLECAETAAREEKNFSGDVDAIKATLQIVENCINFGA